MISFISESLYKFLDKSILVNDCKSSIFNLLIFSNFNSLDKIGLVNKKKKTNYKKQCKFINLHTFLSDILCN